MEELEDRLGDSMEDILAAVQSSLTQSVAVPAPSVDLTAFTGNSNTDTSSWDAFYEDGAADEPVFDDTGAGVGVEGDLDMEED